jgi:hypothetical protein
LVWKLRAALVNEELCNLLRTRQLIRSSVVTEQENSSRLLRTGQAYVWASTRPALLEYSAKLAGSREVMQDLGPKLE